MGSHTWFYYEVESPIKEDYEVIKRRVLEQIKEEIKSIEEGGLKDWILNYTNEIEEYHKNFFKRLFRIVEKDLCKCAVIRRYIQWNEGFENIEFSKINHKFYKDCEGFHDLFRVYDYPYKELFSLEETLEFIENYEKDLIKLNETSIEKLKIFWEKYPNGRIRFG